MTREENAADIDRFIAIVCWTFLFFLALSDLVALFLGRAPV